MKRVLITRPRAQAGAFGAQLKARGFEPIWFPVIAIRPIENNQSLDHALNKLACYDWMIFTSVNGAETVWNRMVSLGIERLPDNLQVAAIGPKTAEALRRRGIRPAFIPDEFIAEAIVPGLGEVGGRWFLLPRAEIARQALPEALAGAGGLVHEIAVYRTLIETPTAAELNALEAGVDVITLTSPSTVHNFIEIVRRAGFDPMRLPGDPIFACIGPITKQAAEQAGLPHLSMASEYTTEGLVDAIQAFEPR
jgi:uroporphyrinogen III methyltransferase/synthase